MTDTKNFITDCIKAHIEVLGPVATLAIARKITSLKIADNGDVLAVAGDANGAAEELKNAYPENYLPYDETRLESKNFSTP